MRKPKHLFIVVLLLGMVNSVFAFDPAEWKYRADVTVEDGSGDYCGLILTPDIYDATRLDLGDIRLVDSHGEEVPYVLARPKDTTESPRYEPAIINRSTNTENAAMVTLDFGKKVMKNSIEVATRGNNFRRTVKVEGSSNNVEFFTLVEQAYIFAISRDTVFEQVDLPANDYRYLRITVEPMAAEEKSPVIDEVKAFKVEKKLAERQLVGMVHIEHSEDEKSNSSIYVYDLGYRRLPISEIELDVADDAFYRYVTLEGRDAATRKVRIDSEDNRQRFREVEVGWGRITGGTIFRYTEASGQERERVVLRIPSSRRCHRYLRITIKNYDDEPLMIRSVSAKMVAHEVIFAAGDNDALALYVGSASARSPRYDIVQRLSDPLQVEARVAKLSAITDNPLFGQVEQKPIPWTERHQVLLLIIMVGVALVLAGFIFKSFKSIRSERVQDQLPEGD